MKPRTRNNRYATIPNEELVARALEMKRELSYRKMKVKMELTKLEKAANMFRNLGATRLAQACGAHPDTTSFISEFSDSDIAERAAKALAGRRWDEANRLHPADNDGRMSAEGAVG